MQFECNEQFVGCFFSNKRCKGDEGLRQVNFNMKHENTVFFESEMSNVHEISSFMFEVQ